jgi:hypothetical protein
MNAMRSAHSPRAFTRALLSDADGGDNCWPIVLPRLHNLDLLTEIELIALPWLYRRWQESGRDVTSLALVRGLHRKMIVRNRLLLVGARDALSQLRDAGIDGALFKGTGLLGRCVPPTGLRAMSDIDLWIRPSQQSRGFSTLGADRLYPDMSVHAETTRDSLGREIDIHIVPSHLFSRRGISMTAAENLFDSALIEGSTGRLSEASLVYFSILNPLFVQEPGRARVAFSLFELDAVLRNQSDSLQLVSELARLARRDDTLLVFVEHLDWLGTGASPPLDALAEEMTQRLTTEEQARREWFQNLHSASGLDELYRRDARLMVHVNQSLTQEEIARMFLLSYVKRLLKHPGYIRKLASIEAWNRLIGLAKSLRRMR